MKKYDFEMYIRERKGFISIPEVQKAFNCGYKQAKDAFEWAVECKLIKHKVGMIYEICNVLPPKKRTRIRPEKREKSDNTESCKKPEDNKNEDEDLPERIKKFIAERKTFTAPQLQKEFNLDYGSAYKIISEFINKQLIEFKNGLEYNVMADAIKKEYEADLIAERRAYLEDLRQKLINRMKAYDDLEDDDDEDGDDDWEDEDYKGYFKIENENIKWDNNDRYDNAGDEPRSENGGKKDEINSRYAFYTRRFKTGSGPWRTIEDYFKEMYDSDYDSTDNGSYAGDESDGYLNDKGEDYDSVKFRLLEEEYKRRQKEKDKNVEEATAADKVTDAQEDAVRLAEAPKNINPAAKLIETFNTINPLARLARALDKIAAKKESEQQLEDARNNLVNVIYNISVAQDDDRRLLNEGKYSAEYFAALGDGAKITRQSDGRFKIVFNNILAADKIPFSVFLLYDGNKTYLSDNGIVYDALIWRIGETRAENKLKNHTAQKPWVMVKDNALLVPTTMQTAKQDILNMYFAQRALLENF